jgi:hypothetical protein
VTAYDALVEHGFVNAFIGSASCFCLQCIQPSIDSLIPLGGKLSIITTPVIGTASF